MAQTVKAAPQQPISLRKKFFSLQTVVSFIALGGLVLLLTTGLHIDWTRTWQTVRHMNPAWYVVAIIVYYTTFIFRGARWRILLMNASRESGGAPVPPPSVLYAARVILISWFANSVTWFRLGDAYRAWIYAEDSKASFPLSAGTVLADRLIDLSVVGVLMAVGIALLLLGGQIHPPLVLLMLAAGVLVAIVAGLATMLLARRWIAPLLPARFAAVYRRFHEGTMGSFGRLPLVFALGVLGWLCETGRLYFVTLAIGVHIAAGLVLFVPMANGLLAAIPLTPGGLGIVETGISGLLGLQLAVSVALAVALVDRTISYVSIIIAGGIAFAIRQVRLAHATTTRPT